MFYLTESWPCYNRATGDWNSNNAFAEPRQDQAATHSQVGATKTKRKMNVWMGFLVGAHWLRGRVRTFNLTQARSIRRLKSTIWQMTETIRLASGTTAPTKNSFFYFISNLPQFLSTLRHRTTFHKKEFAAFSHTATQWNHVAHHTTKIVRRSTRWR